MSAVGNVIAFHSSLRPDGVVGAFNNRARDVWAWAFAEVPDVFHPRHAVERWYRYHLFEDLPLDALREAGALFVGEHDWRCFTSDPPAGPLAIRGVDAERDDDAIVIDVRARSFRRGMVRRIVAALEAHARGDASLADIEAALRGKRRDFGAVPPESLFLMDVIYDFPFQTVLKPKVLDEWRALSTEMGLRRRWLRSVHDAFGSASGDAPPASGPRPETWR